MKNRTRNVAGRSARRWRAAAVAATVGCASAAHADSIADYVRLELGAGASKFADSGDGTWVQDGLPHSEKLTSFAWMVGVTGEPINHLAYHVDFVDLGRTSASTLAVADDDYDKESHRVLHAAAQGYLTPFSGSGRALGFALTLEPNYTWRGIRLGIEGGPYIFRSTWSDTVWNGDGTVSELTHNPQWQVGYVLGASIGYKNFGLSYRYYAIKTKYDPVPALATRANVLMVTYRF